jgi:catechol 2,3-dioxygenase-like lactoylglutathione lyase family enzyme
VITGFDHVVIAVRDLAGAIAAYETLLDRPAAAPVVRNGVATALIALDNIAVELMAPEGDGESARRLSATLEEGEGLKSLVFATDDIERLHRRCARVGIEPEPINGSPDSSGQSFRANTQRTHGVRIFFVQRASPPSARAAVLGLDHVVVQSADMERAAALYGARLGLDMRLDRAVRDRRLMFFRCGDAIVEIANVPNLQHDLLWGLSWRVSNAEAARERLAEAAVDVSEVRPGMKPGTKVFAVRSGTCGVPTLMIEQGKQAG